MSACFHCPHCHQLLELVAIDSPSGRFAQPNGHHGPPLGHPSTLNNGPDPQPGEVVRNAQVQPAGRKNGPAAKRAGQRFQEKRAEQAHRDRARDKRAAVKNGQVCPDHGVARPSRFGGLYCPQPAATPSGWCRWSTSAKAGAA